MKPKNLLFIFSDEHNRDMAGCYGHPVVQTPNLDRLARQGVRFTNAYCNSPICVPSRASMATGQYVHRIGAWDNAQPYVGAHPSWGHRLEAAGHHVTTVGKLHYRQVGDPSGFSDQRLAMHVKDGEGDIYSLIRDDMAPRPQLAQRILEAGPGESEYSRFDRAVAAEASRWLRDEASGYEKPWVLFVGFVTPHFPLIVPKEFFERYPLDQVVFPVQYSLAERHYHPALDELRRVMAMDEELPDDVVRRAVAAYYGLCSFMDYQVGLVLDALRESGLEEDTRIIYTSDHGDQVGAHGLFWKSTMYEGAVAVPFIMSGPDVPRDRVDDTPISLVDCFPTILEAVGVEPQPEDRDLPGRSLWPIARGEVSPKRTIFSEYHAVASEHAFFMVRVDNHKYVYYVGSRPQLFDLQADPNELTDLAMDPRYADVLERCDRELRKICDPEEVDRRARADQKRLVDAHGGRQAVLAKGFQIPYTPAPAAFRGDENIGHIDTVHGVAGESHCRLHPGKTQPSTPRVPRENRQ
ncbi:MAG TPA: sulfatase-like hydrolase/transferase [Chloroflexota bacterium]|nr:sulfatase-like hydrolase/transferase [Chloroflexota bacterium]